MRSNRLALACIGVLAATVPANAAPAGDPAPVGLSVRRQAAWELCPASSGAPAGQKCPTLIVDFDAKLVDPFLGRITGPTAISGRVWSVTSTEIAGRTTTTLNVIEAKPIVGLNGLVLLVLDARTPPDEVNLATHLLTTTFFDSTPPVVLSTTAAAPEEGAGRLMDAEDPDDADLYFAGTVTAIKDKSDLFSVEARLRRNWAFGKNEWGGIIEITAEEQDNIDPDSITLGLSYGRVLSNRRRALTFAALPFGGEFSRDDPKTRGILTAGAATWTVVPTVRGTFALDLIAGYELGNNLANAISDEGSGAVVRGKAGVDAYLRWDKKLGFHRITITGSLLVRMLAKPEIDPDRPDEDENPTLTKRARHRAMFDVNFEMNKRFALALQVRSGPLPPAFEHVNPSIAASLVYKADWR
jgi:hypothetical protein